MSRNKQDYVVEDDLADDLMNELALADEELAEWRDRKVAQLREKAERRRTGRKPFPEKRRRTNRISVSFNEAEFQTVQAFVGARETAEVLRELVLETIAQKNAE